jgi:hypothetical protein
MTKLEKFCGILVRRNRSIFLGPRFVNLQMPHYSGTQVFCNISRLHDDQTWAASKNTRQNYNLLWSFLAMSIRRESIIGLLCRAHVTWQLFVFWVHSTGLLIFVRWSGVLPQKLLITRPTSFVHCFELNCCV